MTADTQHRQHGEQDTHGKQNVKRRFFRQQCGRVATEPLQNKKTGDKGEEVQKGQKRTQYQIPPAWQRQCLLLKRLSSTVTTRVCFPSLLTQNCFSGKGSAPFHTHRVWELSIQERTQNFLQCPCKATAVHRLLPTLFYFHSRTYRKVNSASAAQGCDGLLACFHVILIKTAGATSQHSLFSQLLNLMAGNV